MRPAACYRPPPRLTRVCDRPIRGRRGSGLARLRRRFWALNQISSATLSEKMRPAACYCPPPRLMR
eukprot:5593657-Pyramimonas_sp.AAC.1